MSDLAAFVSARLADDEAAAKAACGGDARRATWRPQDHPSDTAMVWDAHDGVVVYNEGAPDDAEAAHIALHDPARVLREVEAKRAILALHGVTIDRERVRDDSGQTVEEVAVLCRLCGWVAAVEGAGCSTVQLLAAAWSGHPDYQQEWAVS